jgi:hypothetical protein
VTTLVLFFLLWLLLVVIAIYCWQCPLNREPDYLTSSLLFSCSGLVSYPFRLFKVYIELIEIPINVIASFHREKQIRK